MMNKCPAMKYGREYFEEITSEHQGYSFEIYYPLSKCIAEALIEKFHPSRMLDIGCAKGFLVYAFKNKGVDAYGVDISEYAISNAPKEVRDNLFVLDVQKEKLPFSNDFFDLVTMISVIEHLEDFKNVLKEIKRVLKPNGICFIATQNGKKRNDKDPTHVNVHERSFWVKVFKLYNFEITSGECIRYLRKKVCEHFSQTDPSSKIARFLVKFGRIGKYIRKLLIYLHVNLHDYFYSCQFILRNIKAPDMNVEHYKDTTKKQPDSVGGFRGENSLSCIRPRFPRP